MEKAYRNHGLLVAILAVFFSFTPCLLSDDPPVDTDGDGIDDPVEISLGYNPLVFTRIIYVDATQADDSGNGLTPATAKKSIKAGVNAAKADNVENAVVVSSGTYSGADNRGIDFAGYDIFLRAANGAEATIVDLQGAGIFLNLGNGESKVGSRLSGFSIRNGCGSNGGAVSVGNASGLTIDHCLFSGNQAEFAGGAVYLYNASVDIIDTRFFNNRHLENEYMYYESGGGAVYSVSGTCNIDRCEFVSNSAFSGGAVYASGGTMTLSACVFRDNAASYGGVVFLPWGGNVSMSNCLALNNSASWYAFMDIGYESTITMTNCTIQGNLSVSAADMNIGGTLTMRNSIFSGIFSGTPLTVAYCCTVQDCSAYGTGNITSAPQTTPGGYPLAASPCVDTASSSYAPAFDLNGSTRPSGNLPDIGCYEFSDSDSDGIPDAVELAAGLDPLDALDASGDIDGDTLTNLSEFLNGTDPGSSDTDGDGIADNLEWAQGYNPVSYTQIIYVNPSRPDDTGDGFSENTAKKNSGCGISGCLIPLF